MAKTILALKSEGLSVLISEQNLHFAGSVADRATIIEKGLIRFTGTMAELKANEAVLIAGLLRTVLPASKIGMLAVRKRWWDVVCYYVLGGVILAVDIRLH